MNRTAATPVAAGRAAPADWGIFAALVALGGSPYVLIKEALATMPPAVVTVGRLWVGAIFLYVVMRAGADRFPPLKDETSGRLSPIWLSMLTVSFVGYTIPFFIFPWAQQFVESGLAGVYMAFMPLWTVALAHFFANERLTPLNAIGFALGFLGVVILMGADVLAGALGSSIAAQAGLVLATLCYAISVIVSRRAGDVRPRAFACATVLGGAILATPALLTAEISPANWSLSSVASVAALGLGPTGLAGLLIIVIVQRVGAGFMAYANYLTPVAAVALGAAIFHERLPWSVFLALAVALAGVAISRRSSR